jgi:hypothetical protein
LLPIAFIEHRIGRTEDFPMRFSTSLSRTAQAVRGLIFPPIRELRSNCIAVVLTVFATVGAWGQNGQPQHFANRNFFEALAARTPDPLDAMELQIDSTAPGQQHKTEAINEARRELLAAESARLLELAADLKLEIQKTDKDTLSLNAIRKAKEIEKLAKDVRDKMKLTTGGR